MIISTFRKLERRRQMKINTKGEILERKRRENKELKDFKYMINERKIKVEGIMVTIEQRK